MPRLHSSLAIEAFHWTRTFYDVILTILHPEWATDIDIVTNLVYLTTVPVGVRWASAMKEINREKRSG